MKKLYISLASVLMLGVSFGQTNQVKAKPINSTTPTTLNATVKQHPNQVSTTNPDVSGKNTSTSNIDSQVDGHEFHNCKSHELTKQYYEEQGVWEEFNAAYYEQAAQAKFGSSQNKTPGTNTIAIVFHVVHEGEAVGTGTNVSNAAIMAMYNDLVEDFSLTNADQVNARTGAPYNFTPANPGINFCLATQDPNGVPLSETGVTRIQTTETWFDPDDNSEVNAMKSAPDGQPIWDRNDYLNVWICDISNGAGSGTAGYAYRPTGGFLPNASIDGIVVDYNLGVNNENVLTHEVGHYLGLDHTWGGSGSCTSDDGFTDTPNTAGPSFNYGGSCSGTQQTCTGVHTQYENYMDYSNCQVMFTTEQANFMSTLLNNERASLLLSPGCDPAGPPVCSFTSSPAGPGPVIISENGTVVFNDASTGAPTSWTWTISGTQGTDWDYTGGTTNASENPQVTFYNVGNYDVTLVATNGFGSCTGTTEVGYVQVVAPAAGTDCDTLRNYTLAENLAFYNNGGSWGYIPGHGEIFAGFPIDEYAEPHTATATAEVRRMIVPIGIIEDLSGTGSINFYVRADNAGDPGAILATESVLLADLNDFAYNTIDFATPASVTGNFFVGAEIFYGGTQDTVTFYCADLAGRPAGAGTVRLREGTTWFATDDYYTGGINMSIAWDVLLSNGPAPVADFQFSEAAVCPGGDITVNASGSTNATNYEWYQTDDPVTTIIDDNFTAGTTFNFAGPAGAYQIFLFTEGSCLTDGLVLPVTVYSAITATANVTHTTCGENNGSVSITGAAGGDGVNYEYSLDGVNYQTGNTYSNLPAGNYTAYIKTTGDACEATIAFTINGSTALSGSATATVGICPGGTANLTASGGTGYTWYDGATVIGTSATIAVSPAVQSQYTVEITDGTCTDVQQSLVTVNPTPTIDGGVDQAVCSGTAVTLTASGAVSYSWDNGVTDGIPFTPASTTTYTVTGTDGNGCQGTDMVTVTVNSAPTTSGLAETCNGTNTAYTVSFDVTGGTAPYTIGGETGSFSGSTWTSDLINSGVSYAITITDANGCTATPISGVQNCSCTTDAGTMSTSPALTLCGPGAQTATANNDEAFDGDDVQEFYLHTGAGAALGTTIATSTTPTFSFTGGMTYGTTYYISSVVGNDAGGGTVDLGDPCLSVSAGTPVTWYDLPTVDAGVDQTVCENATVTVSGSGATSYSWDNGVTNGIGFTATTTTTYTVTGTDVNGCQNTDAMTVTVNTAPTIDAGVDQTVCAGDMVTLSGSGGVSYTWDNGVTDGTAFAASATTTYTVTSADGAGCTNTDMVTVTVNALPTVDAGVDQSVCSGEMVTLSGAGAVTYVWDNGVTDGTAFSALSTTTYTVTGTDANNCSNTDMVTVTVTDGPTIMGVITHDDGTTNGAIDATITGGAAPYTISWDNAETTEDITDLAAGDYTITVTDANGCVSMMTFTVLSTVGIENELDKQLLIFPNPTKGIVNIQLEGDYSLTILDARGRLVHTSNEADNASVDLTSFEAGVYFIRVQKGGDNAMRRIILE